MAEILTEIRKIPPVTRFLVISSLGITVSAIMKLVSPWKLVFLSQGVIKNFERRSSDYAWQLFLVSLALVGVNRPIQSYLHTRALLHTLTYLMCSLSPPGALTSIMGLITVPIAYFPYALLGMDLLMGGTSAAAQGVSGMLIGHAWWWLVWGSGIGSGGVEQGMYAGWGRAPPWLKRWYGERDDYGRAGSRRGAVQAFAPRQRAEEAAASGRVTGYSWGSGRRLGDS
ncbi:hypothetical protein EV702DRAFT_1088487 [Suillus placidus]|uniref:Derlin n=1 Tax=Suillus placidus TaxID=48579 RepID=A0A9P6ZZ99_9AGAM|nr:hypothetical protein EV702DRAFT_1088487 [Suillus placidus]